MTTFEVRLELEGEYPLNFQDMYRIIYEELRRWNPTVIKIEVIPEDDSNG